MKILTVLGARPQFIKASVVSHAFQIAGIQEILVHTGQHFDTSMSDVFFRDLGIPDPDYHLGIHSLNHGVMTGRMMEALETLVLKENPDWLLVYGDTNSTLAGALVAAKLHVPVAHIEAGLRSYNREMPEEINRVVTDQLSTLLFAPTPLAVECLTKEGITQGVYMTGDVMMDATLQYQTKAEEISTILTDHDLEPNQFYLATIHRPSNTDDRLRLSSILDALSQLNLPVIFPLHPRTKKLVQNFGLEEKLKSLKVVPPATYLDMLVLEKNAKLIITDSGGIQKEAFLARKPCFTLRTETEWVETLESGWNTLVEPNHIQTTIQQFVQPKTWPSLYGDGQASSTIVQILTKELKRTTKATR